MKNRNIQNIKTVFVVMSLVFCVTSFTDAAFGQLLSNTLQSVQSLTKSKKGDDLRKIVAKSTSLTPVNVVFSLKAPMSGSLNAFLSQNGIKIRARYSYFNNLMPITLPAGKVDQLAGFSEVAYVAFDREIRTLGHVTNTTGADSARQQTAGNGYPGVDGSGIGIAIVDSGIDANHTAFLGKNGVSRVIAGYDFTGEGRLDDPFGHGTHVAATAAGNGRISNAAYMGVAPNANLINLRVLNSQGLGSNSGLINALDWIMVNRVAYNIRVVNLSLGGMAIDSYKDDPVCIAVRRLVDAGVVVVAAAGNN